MDDRLLSKQKIPFYCSPKRMITAEYATTFRQKRDACFVSPECRFRITPAGAAPANASGYSVGKRPPSSYWATGRVMCDSAEQYTRCAALT